MWRLCYVPAVQCRARTQLWRESTYKSTVPKREWKCTIIWACSIKSVSLLVKITVKSSRSPSPRTERSCWDSSSSFSLNPFRDTGILLCPILSHMSRGVSGWLTNIYTHTEAKRGVNSSTLRSSLKRYTPGWGGKNHQICDTSQSQ